MDAMKAILQATFAAIVSGILVGVLLKKKVAGVTRSP
jgi:F0F1-type ATP synthase membrane subunit c/vacuolar-type H+-ATPase subunit K